MAYYVVILLCGLFGQDSWSPRSGGQLCSWSLYRCRMFAKAPWMNTKYIHLAYIVHQSLTSHLPCTLQASARILSYVILNITHHQFGHVQNRDKCFVDRPVHKTSARRPPGACKPLSTTHHTLTSVVRGTSRQG